VTVELQIVHTRPDLAAVFAVRHQVFSEEEGRLGPRAGGVIFDAFDTFDATTNVLARVGEEPAGVVRVSVDGAQGLPLDAHYDLTLLRNACRDADGRQRRTGCVTMLGVRRAFRHVPGVVQGLLRAARTQLDLLGVEDLIVIVNPDIAKLMRSLGLRPLGQPITCSRVGQELIAMHCSLAEIRVPPIPVARGAELGSLVLLGPGEVLHDVGDPAGPWHVVLEGRLSLELRDGRGQPASLASVGPGAIVGQRGGGVLLHRIVAEEPVLLERVDHPTLLATAGGSAKELDALLNGLGCHTRAAAEGALRAPPEGRGGLSLFHGFLEARLLDALGQLGLFERLAAGELIDVPVLVERLGVRADLAPAVAAYLRTRLGGDAGASLAPDELTRFGHEAGFVQWLVGGYGPVLQELPALLKGDASYAEDARRDDGAMAAASASIGQHFTDPALWRIIEDYAPERILDVGCGDASRLIALLSKTPSRAGVGVDLSAACVASASAKVERAGLQDRIDIHQSCGLEWLEKTSGEPVDLVICCGMFHDLLNRPGAAQRFLAELRRVLGPGCLVVLQDQLRQRPGTQSASWVAGFELIHALMGQQLFSADIYRRVIADAGLTLVDERETDIPENRIFVART